MLTKMGEALVKWAKASKQADRKSDRPRDDGLAAGERKALWTLRKEAKQIGATLASGGKGGLPPSLVLGVMRRDGYECKKCGSNKALSIHHKNFHMHDPRQFARAKLVKAQGKRNDPAQIVTLCDECHDKLHEEDREENPNEPEVS